MNSIIQSLIDMLSIDDIMIASCQSFDTVKKLTTAMHIISIYRQFFDILSCSRFVLMVVVIKKMVLTEYDF